MKTFSEMMALSIPQLLQEIQRAEHELVGIRMHIVAGQEKDSSKQKKMRRYIARLRTAKRQKELSSSETV